MSSDNFYCARSRFSKLLLFSLLDYFLLHAIHFWDDWFQTKKREQIGIPNKFHLKIFDLTLDELLVGIDCFDFLQFTRSRRRGKKCCSVNSPAKLCIISTLNTEKKKLLSRAVKADRKWAAILAENLGDQVIFKTYKYYSAVRNIICQITSSVFLPQNTS